MWDDVEHECAAAIILVADFVDRQRHALNGDRALGCDKWREFLGGTHIDPPAVAFFLGAGHFTHRIDMAGDNMSTQLIAHA